MILHYFGKIAHFDVHFTVFGLVLVSAGFLAPQSAFPTILPLKHTQKRRKSANSGSPFSKTKERLQPLQATFDPSCPRLSSLGNDREKRVSAHCRGAGAKIAFLNEYARDLVVSLIVPGNLLLPQISIVRFVGLLFSWRCSAIF